MKRLTLILLATGALFALGCGILLYLAVDTRASVVRGETIDPASIAQARRLFHLNDPRRMRDGQQRRASVPDRLIDEGVNHLAARFTQGRGRFVVDGAEAIVTLSLPLPGLAPPRHVNIEAGLANKDRSVQVSRLKVGRIDLPPAVVSPAVEVLARLSGYGDEWRALRASIDLVRIIPDLKRVDLVYTWRPQLLSRFTDIALPPAQIAYLEDAQRRLAALLGPRTTPAEQPLVNILLPMLASTAGDRFEQRRASLLVLASYLAGARLSALIPEAADWPRPRRSTLTLQGREDSAQHFIVSATLSAWAGEPVADAIGLYKELDDARRGSGFSFADLAADRAGTRFGKLLSEAPARIDRLLAGAANDDDLVPPLEGLPEFIPEAEFRRRFGSIDSPAYRERIDDIEHRISTRPLYRPAP